MSSRSETKRLFSGWIVGFLLLLTGCDVMPEFAANEPAAPLPGYSPGDSYDFDDDTNVRVSEVLGDHIRWQSGDGSVMVTTRNVMLPPVFRTSSNLREEQRFTLPHPLFPLFPGRDVAFTDVVITASPTGASITRHEQWQCSVGQPAQVWTGAGPFDTWTVDCSVVDLERGRHTSHRYFYAPSIGFYVRREDITGGSRFPHVAVLLRYATGDPPLSDSALRLRAAAIKSSLAEPSNKTLEWHDPATSASGEVRPLGPIRVSDQRSCRNFREQIDAVSRRYVLKGTGCRDESGGWQVTGIEPEQARGGGLRPAS
jgi:hypothetical protein